jgi:hypothetical protein
LCAPGQLDLLFIVVNLGPKQPADFARWPGHQQFNDPAIAVIASCLPYRSQFLIRRTLAGVPFFDLCCSIDGIGFRCLTRSPIAQPNIADRNCAPLRELGRSADFLEPLATYHIDFVNASLLNRPQCFSRYILVPK